MFGYTRIGSKRRLIRPWTTIDAFFHIFNEENGKCYYLDNNFTSETAKHISTKFMYVTIGLSFVYVLIGIPLWMYVVVQVFWYYGMSLQQQQQKESQQYGIHQNSNSNGQHNTIGNSNGHHTKVE